jgi:catechol 2,3-dioxygenase-like lactoylglutathione lyase family enzyme
MGTQKTHAILLAASVALAGCTSSPSAPNLTERGSEATDDAEHGHFHHVHLNVTDIAKTTAFYEKTFGVISIPYAGKAPALMAERSFIFLNEVPQPASQLQTGVIHVGWSGVDGASEYAWLQKQGVEFYTPLSRLGAWEYFYLYGPDREVIEIWTQDRHHRFNHVHMLSPNPKATAEWFAKVTNSAEPAQAGSGLPGYWKVDYGDVALDILPDAAAFRPKERTGALQRTDGAGIDHLAFSFRDLATAEQRITSLGIPIERPIAIDPTYGVKSFFVRSPEGVLVELVEANPLPEAAWD